MQDSIDLKEIHRINVIGTSGSGKSTFCKKLSTILKIPYVEIDQIYWGPDWHAPGDEDFFPKLEAAIAGEKWILDGNYSRTTFFKWKNVQLVIWLDYSFPKTFFRGLSRVIYRAYKKQEIWPGTGNKESFKMSFLSKDSILWWAIKTYPKHKKEYGRLTHDEKYRHIRFIRFRKPQEAENFLSRIIKSEI